MKKIVSLLIVIAMLAAMLPASIVSVFAVADTAVTEISNAQQFLAINGEGNYALTADIDLGGQNIGTAISIGGTLDGNGHTVKNFTITSTAGGDYSLFSLAADTTIKNINFGAEGAGIAISVKPEASSAKVAVIAASIGAKALTLEKSEIYINADTKNAQFGAVAAVVNGTLTVSEVSVNGMVAMGDSKEKGAFVGLVGDSGNVTVSKSENNADITLATGCECAGGLIGQVYGEAVAPAVKIELSRNNGNILSPKGLAGGAIGRVKNGSATVKGFVNYGDFTSGGETNCGQIGGVVGRADVEITIDGTANFGKIIGGWSGNHVSGILGRLSGSSTLKLTNSLNAGQTLACDIVRNDTNNYTVGADCFYLATTGAPNHNGATKLDTIEDVYKKLNEMDAFGDYRAYWGSFAAAVGDISNEVLASDRTVPADPQKNYTDSPFTEFKPGYVLHHMDFSKVNSFAETGYYITKDNLPTTFYVKDGALHLGSGDNKVYMVMTGNNIPKNISNLTFRFKVSFENIGSHYLCVLNSVMIDQANGNMLKMIDTAVRGSDSNGNIFPQPDGLSITERGEDGKVTAEAAEKWAALQTSFATGSELEFTFSYSDSKMDKVTITDGTVSVDLNNTGYNGARDLASYLGFMVRNMTVAISEITVIAGSSSEYTDLIWPAEAGALVTNVSADAVKAPDGGDDNPGDETSGEDVTTKTPANETTAAPEDPTTPTKTTNGTTEAPKDDKGGCASSIEAGILPLLALIAVCAAAVLVRKKVKE